MANPLYQYMARMILHQTKAEAAIEPQLAKLGIPYRFQWIPAKTKFIVDYAWLAPKVILEVDGKDHLELEKLLKDKARDATLVKLGWTVFRITNEEALSNPSRAFAKLVGQGFLSALGVT